MVIEAKVAERDRHWHLIRVEFAGGSLWVRDNDMPLGHRARVRILARDVSLSHSRGEDTSILNALPARVSAIADCTSSIWAAETCRFCSSCTDLTTKW